MALLSGRIPTGVPTWPTMLAIDDIVPVPATPPTGSGSRPTPPSLLACVLKDLQAAELEISLVANPPRNSSRQSGGEVLRSLARKRPAASFFPERGGCKTRRLI